jgi:anthranilate phosphoribosyltransferase
MIKEGIAKLVERHDLSLDDAEQIMREIMRGEATPAQISAFLTALRLKGETIEEITALAIVMRQFATHIHPTFKGRLIDIVGTGGDRIKTVNVSTTAALIAAGAGATVAKHGNRSFTSRCGAADILERFGLNLKTEPSIVRRSIETVGIGFLFAPRYHPAMKHALPTRREIGIRTVFNILGPITNPADADAQLIGVYDPALVRPLAEVTAKLGLKEALVVHGFPGLDEISTLGPTTAARMKDGDVKTTQISPGDFGLKAANPDELGENDIESNAESIFKILTGHPETNRRSLDLVMANAAAGVTVAGLTDTFGDGMDLAQESIRSGAAYSKLKLMVKISEGDSSKLEELEKRFG